jgi:hypothetical protein
LVVVPYVDFAAVANHDLGAPEACYEIVEASSPSIADEAAFAIAIKWASCFPSWLLEAEGLPFEAARKLLRDNGLYIGDPEVVPLEMVPIFSSSEA